ncbi:MAG: hypothetical protein LBV70_06620, partial [Candidatus Adiutrix sp.]|nr:hypothetical protein [Candidatus Adiutrix sp.]
LGSTHGCTLFPLKSSTCSAAAFVVEHEASGRVFIFLPLIFIKPAEMEFHLAVDFSLGLPLLQPNRGQLKSQALPSLKYLILLNKFGRGERI